MILSINIVPLKRTRVTICITLFNEVFRMILKPCEMFVFPNLVQNLNLEIKISLDGIENIKAKLTKTGVCYVPGSKMGSWVKLEPLIVRKVATRKTFLNMLTVLSQQMSDQPP